MPDASVTRQVADRVRSLRSQLGWSAQRLGVKCAEAGMPSLTRGTIAKIESGVRKSITAEEVAVLARVLGVTPTDLMASASAMALTDDGNRARSLAAASAEEVGTENRYQGLGLLPVSAWDPIRLGVHPTASERPDMPRLPPYIWRRHDRDLHALLRKSANRSTAVLLVGKPATGKTRSLYEAALTCIPDRPLFFPLTSRELVDARSSGVIRPGTVVWLDDLRTYFDGPAGAQAAAALRSLLRSDYLITVLGTIQSGYWAALITPPEQRASDPWAHARDVLMTADVFQVAEILDAEERAAASVLGTNAPSLAAADKAARDGRLIPVLTAAPALIARYEHAPDPYGAAILTAAMDAYRLGHLTPLSRGFLQEAAPAYLTDAQRAAPSGWFDSGLQYATTPVLGGLCALSAVRTGPGVGPSDGYVLQDFLADYGKAMRAELAVPVPVWDALLTHTTNTDDRQRLATAAEQWLPGDYHIRFQTAAPGAKWAEDLAAEVRRTSDVVTQTMQDYVATGRLTPAKLEDAQGLAPESARANIKLLIAEVEPAPHFCACGRDPCECSDASNLQSLSLPCTEDPELFFAESPEDVEAAKALCRECPARLACLAGAVERMEPWGVWGGELFLRGSIVPRKRPRGRVQQRREAS